MIAVLLIRKIVQLFFILILGYVVVKMKLVRAEDSKVLSKLALYLLVPFVILKSFQMELTPDIQKGMLFAFGCIALAVYVRSRKKKSIYAKHKEEEMK